MKLSEVKYKILKVERLNLAKRLRHFCILGTHIALAEHQLTTALYNNSCHVRVWVAFNIEDENSTNFNIQFKIWERFYKEQEYRIQARKLVTAND